MRWNPDVLAESLRISPTLSDVSGQPKGSLGQLRPEALGADAPAHRSRSGSLPRHAAKVKTASGVSACFKISIASLSCLSSPRCAGKLTLFTPRLESDLALELIRHEAYRGHEVGFVEHDLVLIDESPIEPIQIRRSKSKPGLPDRGDLCT